MRLRRLKLFRALTLGVGGLVLGCQGPDVRTGPAERGENRVPASSRPRIESPGRAQTSTPAKPVKKSVLEGIRPADSLSACRPLKDRQVSVTRFLQEPPAPATEENQFRIPETIPGADVPPLVVPERDPDVPYQTHREQVRAAYKKLPEVPDLPFSPADQSKERISLAELQEIAYANSPLLPAAAARVEQARGEAIQAGLYPNPEAGYQADTVNTSDTAGYHGVYASQTVITADKRKIARSVACQDVVIAELELRQVEIDLATAVRRNYFRALIAQERLKLAQALADLFQQSYEAQIDLVAGGETAAYEPLQLRVFAVQARNAVIQAGNDYVAAWRALAAVLNAPNLTPRELEGSPEMAVPQISYQAAFEILLARHTDLSIAQTRINRSEFNLWLQQVTPIPDVNLGGAIFYDDTSPLNDLAFNLQVGVPLPLLDRNQGNIYEAQSQIMENHHRLAAAQNDLTAELAEIYGRYTANRALARNFREEILPDQVRTYRGVNQQFRQGAGDLDFAQIIVTQQQLGELVGDYVDVLQAQWEAVVDLAELLQADDLFSLDQVRPAVEPKPDAGDPLLVPIPDEKPE